MGGFIFDEFNKEVNELNEIPKESYSYDETKTYNELNSNLEKERPQKTRKVFASFMFACASVAVLPIGVYVPLFSEIFSTENVIEAEQQILETKYDIGNIRVKQNSIECSVVIENADITKDNYFIYVVKEVDATDAFLAGVSDSMKQNYQIKINQHSTNLTLTKFMYSTGGDVLKPATSYAIILVRSNKIVQKQIVKTEKFYYVKCVEFKPTTTDKLRRYLNVQVKINEEFSEYNQICYELFNLTTNTQSPEHYSITTKELVSTSYAGFGVLLTEPEYDYELRIYCSTNHPEKLNYSASLVKDEITYYLIYTYGEIIHF